MNRNYNLLTVSFSLILALSVMLLAANIVFATPTVTTDKSDYSSGDTVVISGSGFPANMKVVVQINRPSGTDMFNVKTDDSGIFTLDYKLTSHRSENAIYTVLVIDPKTQVVLASTTFSDPTNLSVDFRQCANQDAIAGQTPAVITGNCHWINSIVQASNAIYYENMVVDQRAVFTNAIGTTHTLIFSHEATKGKGIHAYDFLASWGQSNNPAPIPGPDGSNATQIRECGSEISATEGATCTHLKSLNGGAGYYFDAPAPDDNYFTDSNDPAVGDEHRIYQHRINEYESMYGDRFIRIYADVPITNAYFDYVTDTDVSPINCVDGDGVSSSGLVKTCHDTANDATTDDYIHYKLVVVTESSSSELMFEIGGHLAAGGSHEEFHLNWGPNIGSSSISGGPYHFKLDTLDGSSLGSQDNQIKGADIQVLPPTLDITKTCPAKVEIGTTFDCVVTLSNTAGDSATGVEVQDTLPAGVTYVSASATSGTVTQASGVVTWSGSITNGGTVTITITVTASTSGTKINTAAYTVAPTGTLYTHQTATCTTQVIDVEVGVTKDATAKVEIGGTISVSALVTNTGSVAAMLTSVSDSDAGALTCSPVAVGSSLGVNASTTCTGSYTASSTAGTDSDTVTAVLTDQTGATDTATASDTTQVIEPAISVVKTCSPDTQTAPGMITWTIMTTNTGSTPLSVVLTETMSGLPTSVSFTLAPNGSDTRVYNSSGLGAGTYNNTALVTGTDQLGTVVTAESTATCEVTQPAPTRTIGYWATHTNITQTVFHDVLGGSITIGAGDHTRIIDTDPKLFGAFLSSIPYKSDESRRNAVDQARMILLQQLVGAILNHAIGTPVPLDPVTGLDLITAGNNAYAGNDKNEMTRVAGLLDSFNGSGDDTPLPDGYLSESATPDASHALADAGGIAFWDNP